MPSGNGEGERITSDAALAFWGSTADLAWARWRRDLEAVKESLDVLRAESAAWGAALEKRKADVDAEVAFWEAESARLQVETELAEAKLERTLHELRGGWVQ